MDAWEQWREMAAESAEAARLAEAGGCLRSAASRYYYAAYQSVTALLLYRGLTPPLGREAWNHEDTPYLIQTQMSPLIERQRRKDMAFRLRELYRRRLTADYSGIVVISEDQVTRAGRDARYILRLVNEYLPEKG